MIDRGGIIDSMRDFERQYGPHPHFTGRRCRQRPAPG